MTMGNQQETRIDIHYIAGLMDGEGCLTICKIMRGDVKRHQYRAHIQFTNTDMRLITVFVEFLKEHYVAHFIRRDDRPRKQRVCYYVSIPALDSQRRFLELMMPYLIGKQDHAKLLLNYVERRIRLNRDREIVRNKSGQFVNGKRAPHTPEDEESYQQVQSVIRGSSETARATAEQ